MAKERDDFDPSEVNRYTAGITHTEQSIRKMCEIQFNTFLFGRKMIQFVAAAAMIGFGIIGGTRSQMALVFLAVGCVLIVSLNHRPRQTADTLLRQFNGKLPKLHYFFSDKGISTNQVPERTPYSRVSRLVEDSGYFYVFLDTAAGYMIEKESVKGSHTQDGFRDYIAGKTGVEWTRPTTLFNMNIKSILLTHSANKKMREKNSVFIGERLSDRPRRR